jgi:hypothetical protein
MRSSWQRASRGEKRFENWLEEHHQRRVLAGETTPTGSCPGESFLRQLARRSKQIRLSDPRVEHSANCRICMNRLLAIRGENRSRLQILAFSTAAVACLVVLALVFIRHPRQHLTGNMAVVSRTVNLWDASAIRGHQPSSLQSSFLPASIVRLTVILPRFSRPGQYEVAVTRDQNGNGVVAQGIAPAVSAGDQEKVSVMLDLSRAPLGAYFLATIHEQDQASYYYPLEIR